jgi:hypothetical protein
LLCFSDVKWISKSVLRNLVCRRGFNRSLFMSENDRGRCRAACSAVPQERDCEGRGIGRRVAEFGRSWCFSGIWSGRGLRRGDWRR